MVEEPESWDSQISTDRTGESRDSHTHSAGSSLPARVCYPHPKWGFLPQLYFSENVCADTSDVSLSPVRLRVSRLSVGSVNVRREC